jgi:hypothetical protein
MEEVSVKMQDFNIYDLFKGGVGGEGGSSDVSILLVQNLEKKVFKKFEFIDEKTKKQDEESYRHKNEIGNLKNNIDQMNKQINNNIKNNDHTFNDFNNIIEEYKDKFYDIEIKIQSIYKKIMDDINNKEKNFANEMQNNYPKNEQENPNERNNDDKSGNNFSEIEIKMVRDCAKKINDLEKQFKILVNNINIDNIKNEIGKLNENIAQKANTNEVYEMKDNICKFFLFSYYILL